MIIYNVDGNIVYENNSSSKDDTLAEMLEKKISFKKIILK
jgi:hypothetical protein